MEKLDRQIEEVIAVIKNSSEYQKCLELKDLMDKNSGLMELISEIKNLQKSYIRSGYDSKYEKELEEKNSLLESIPLYKIYLDNLEIVNNYIDYVRDSLNEYFDDLLNEKY